MQIIAIWNTAARLRLNNHNPTWIRDLARDILKHGNTRVLVITQFSMPSNPKIEIGFMKFGKLPLDY